MTVRDASTDKVVPRTPGRTAFRDLHCHSADFEFAVTLDKFALEDFKKPFHERFKEPLTSGVTLSALASTRDPKATEYHVHVDWYLSKNQVNVSLGYFPHAIPASEDEKEPFAEDAMQWLGKFFKAEKASAHVHVAFEYPADKWRFLFPLPIKIPLGSEPEVEIDGMSLNLQKGLLGMNQAWLVSREDKSRVLLYGDRMVHFNKFDIIQEIGELSQFAKGFIKEVRNETADK